MEPMRKIKAANDNGLKRDVYVRIDLPNPTQVAILATIFCAAREDTMTAANDNKATMGQARGQ